MEGRPREAQTRQPKVRRTFEAVGTALPLARVSARYSGCDTQKTACASQRFAPAPDAYGREMVSIVAPSTLVCW